MMIMQRPRRKVSVVDPKQLSFSKVMLRGVAKLLAIIFVFLIIWLFSWLGAQSLVQNAVLPFKRVVLLRPLVYADRQSLVEQVNHFGHKDLLQIDVNLLAEELRKIDWVKTVNVTKEWPDALRIDVQERVPMLRWGENRFLDNEAKVFSVPESPALAMLFPVQGPQGSEAQVLEMYLRLNPWLNAQGLSIQRLVLDERQVWYLYLENGIEVIVGREDLNKRLKKLVVIKEKLFKRYGQYIAALDLRYSGGFSVRWKAGVSPADAKKIEMIRR